MINLFRIITNTSYTIRQCAMRLSSNKTIDKVMGQLIFENGMKKEKKTPFIMSVTHLGEWRTQRVCRRVCGQDQIVSAEYWQFFGGPVFVTAALAVAAVVVFNFIIHQSRINRILSSGITMNISTNLLQSSFLAPLTSRIYDYKLCLW